MSSISGASSGGAGVAGITTINGTTGSTTGPVVTFVGAGGISTAVSGTTLTITGSAGGITTINGDVSDVTGSTVSFLANGSLRAGNTWDFTGDGSTTMALTSTDSTSKNTATGLDNNFLVGRGGFTGVNNSTYGYNVLFSPAGTVCSNNNAFGSSCLTPGGDVFGSITLTANNVFGTSTLNGPSSTTTATCANNCLFGNSIMHNAVATSASQNCVFGNASLGDITTGTNNLIFGFGVANEYTSSESNNIIIGGGAIVSESNKTKIGYIGGATSQTGCFIDGIDGVTVTGTAVLVATGGQLGIAVSSAKYKDNIQDMGDSSSRALNLRPVTFSYKGGNDTRFGLIAEEVAQVLPEIVVHDKAGDPQTVMYHELPSILLNELQKALKRIEILESKLGV